jgi:hypothetical protein
MALPIGIALSLVIAKLGLSIVECQVVAQLPMPITIT